MVVSTDFSAVEETGPAPQFLGVSSHPNPFTPLTTLHLRIPVSDANTKIQIYDASGRMVRTLHEGATEPGLHVFSWTGTDDEGRSLPTGTYYCLAQCAGHSTSTKIIRVR
jgi:flagellar hook assembly protein FlgD